MTDTHPNTETAAGTGTAATPPQVAMFTDTYHPTVNGVTYTIDAWRQNWQQRGGQLDVVYPAADEYRPADDEHPVPSLAFPFYEGYRVGAPHLPDSVASLTPDVIHAQSAFSVGLAGLRLARRTNTPFVATYHTPVNQYVDYITSLPGLSDGLQMAVEQYERWFYNQADLVLVPSSDTRTYLTDALGVTSRVDVLSNGVDITTFRPVSPDTFCATHDLPTDTPLIGYTGRHGYEKQLDDILDAVADLDTEATLVFGGDGPARSDLEARAATIDVDVRFLGFLDHDALPAFYSALDVFAFPSPIETEGLVALEAMACGTPIVGADDGALVDTIDSGGTGYRFPTGDTAAFSDRLADALTNRDQLSETCLDRRDQHSVDATVQTLQTLYRTL